MELYYYLKREKRDSETLFRHSLTKYIETTELGIQAGEAFMTEIARTKHGKPYLPSFPGIHFSISHSGDCWGCLLSNENVGLDIEDVVAGSLDSQDRIIRIAERFFAEDEIDFIKTNQSDISIIDRFYDIWTKKEAYIKFTGEGLGAGLNTFSVISGLNSSMIFERVELGEGIVTVCCYEQNHRASGSIILHPQD